ncbi:hypothetical protein KUTeg_008321 [Tegillarca granosa]|uniref:Vps41 beta-propeller domain-containing protein n=1 Tax=Tegillarca granosa TaxID=220873 RepID=A0ABQ9F8U5_TEGGR|nr:hypothetical protein KUTeg_008321 [Tegillarca granosa]
MIYILDHIGNNIRGQEMAAVHTTTVNQISIDDNGDHIASCSDDGRVVISGLYTRDNDQNLNFDRPVKAIAIDPSFYKHGSGKQFITGDDKLILNEKGFLNRHKTIILHQGEGPVREIKWRGSFIAWANDNGVKIYDMTSRSRITFIAKGHSERADLYHCSLYWKDDRTLLLAWADTVKICIVKDRTTQDARGLPSRYVEIVAMFTTDFYVCGIAPLENIIVVVSCEKDGQNMEGGRLVSKRPHLQILEPHMDTYEELSNDAISIRGFEEYSCNHYQLECITEENLFYIVSPKDIIVAKQRNQDDHIAWLLDHEMYEEAMVAAKQNEHELKKHTYQDIGRQYLDSLMDEGDYEEAARLCVKILGKSKEKWEEEVLKFHKINQLKAVAQYIPTQDPVLSPAIYEMILNEFIQCDCEKFLKTLKEWPPTLYKIENIITATSEKLDRDRDNKILLQALGELYGYERSFDKALAIFIRLKHKDVFTLIHKHNLFNSISDKIVQLMEFDKEQAVSMLINNMDKISIDKVVQQLEKKPSFLHIYLDKIFQKDPQLSHKYHGKQVSLYAQFDRPKLLPFLRSSNYYPLQEAMEVCEIRQLIPEQVFLLGRMGNVKQALHLITDQLGDVDRFVKGLLQNIGTHVDPIILINRIKLGMEIPDLRDALVKILQDYHLQI